MGVIRWLIYDAPERAQMDTAKALRRMERDADRDRKRQRQQETEKPPLL